MNYYSPAEAAEVFKITAINKTKLPFLHFAIMSILGGAFIALGGLLTVMVAGGMPGVGSANPGIVKFMAGALFPVGLIMVSVTGGDLFTSNCAGQALPFLRRETSLIAVLKVLILSYVFNFIGTQFIAYVLSANVGLLDTDPWRTYLHHYSEAKMNQDFGRVLVKGIGANWLVCLGMFMGYAAKDIMGKSVAIWIPVMIFVTLGYEHSIANMFFIPAAIYSGAEITWIDFLHKNLLPATIGNVIGGGVLVGMAYWFLFLRPHTNTGKTDGID